MNLLLLTKFFPYGTGEAFIENEIGVLARYYEHITVIACEPDGDMSDVRKVPGNVSVYKVPASSKKKDIFNGLLQLTNADDDLREEKNYCKGLTRRAFLGYFEAKSRRVFEYIKEHNFLNGLEENNYVLYSYWLFMTARVSTLIAMEIPPALMISRAHGYDLYEEINKINYLPYRRLFLRRFDNVFPCSKNGSDYLKKKYPGISENVTTSHLGTTDFGTTEASGDGVFRIASCSRVVPIKRLNRLVNALSLLEDSGLRIEWTHFGGGSGFEELKKLCESKLKNIRYILKGDTKHTELMRIYSENPIDLFVNVSSSEGLPVSIMEAISFSIPVAATDVGGTKEIVVNGETGMLIPPDFTDERLSRVLKEFITGKIKIDRSACRDFWEKNYTAKKNYQKFCEFSIAKISER